jgi:chemotaxis protein MotB
MSTDRNKRPIIIKKAAKKHHGHHGGSWKVAYADFVTAMMAFFMVLWIMGMDAGAKELIQGYFQNPMGFKKGFGGGQNPMSAGNAPQNLDLKRLAMMAREGQAARFAEAIDEMRLRLETMPELEALKDHIEFVVTNEGLRIELLDDSAQELFFTSGSAAMLPQARVAIEVIGQELAKLPNPVILEGHTDARQYGSERYSNWELSVDRANSSRRALLTAGVRADRVVEVRGYADRHLRVVSDPLDPSNRRISILLPFTEPEINAPAAPPLAIPGVPSPGTEANGDGTYR